jgi:hypothetical protein
MCQHLIKRVATRLAVGVRDKSYEDRLQLLKLATLETRRIRGDLEMFMILEGLQDIDSGNFFDRAVGSTRGHELKVVKPRDIS